MRYLAFLDFLHRALAPHTYLEIGVRSGTSLALSRCRTVAIDPAFTITAEIDCDLALFRTSSDEYFSRPDPLAPTQGRPFDLAFIDGLHLFEFALRDFIHTEQHSSAASLIVFDDVLPSTAEHAARVRRTRSWTGDVYPIIAVLARYRPELTVIPVNTSPTGLLLVAGLDPTSTVLSDHYDAILAEYRHPDPQPVPPELMDRLAALPPQLVIDSALCTLLAAARAEMDPVAVRGRLSQSLGTALGPAFGGQSRQPAAAP